MKCLEYIHILGWAIPGWTMLPQVRDTTSGELCCLRWEIQPRVSYATCWEIQPRVSYAASGERYNLGWAMLPQVRDATSGELCYLLRDTTSGELCYLLRDTTSGELCCLRWEIQPRVSYAASGERYNLVWAMLPHVSDRALGELCCLRWKLQPRVTLFLHLV